MIMMPTLKIFVSYCHADKRALAGFAPFQKTLEREGLITIWTDEKIQQGALWRKQIEKGLQEARIAILFISENFLASDFIWRHELPPLLSACEQGRLTILPVFVSPSTVAQTEVPFTHPETGQSVSIKLTEFQGFTTANTPLMKLTMVQRQEIFVKLAAQIRVLAQQTPPVPLLGDQVISDSSGQNGHSLGELPQQQSRNRTDKKNKRYEKLQKAVATAIGSSSTFMDRLDKAILELGGDSAGRSGSSDRAVRLTMQLMNLNFDTGKSILLNIFDQLNDVDAVAAAAIQKASRLLIPWLYVAGQNMDIGLWEQGVLGRVCAVPAGLSSFAEIVFAGIENRAVMWKEISDPDCFPRGLYNVDFKQPEGGPQESTERDLRDDLFKTVKPPDDVAFIPVAQKDEAIARRIEYLFGRGTRVYLISWMPTGDAGLRYLEQIKRIQARYPVLAIITLDTRLMGEHQTLFDEIRLLLL